MSEVPGVGVGLGIVRAALAGLKRFATNVWLRLMAPETISAADVATGLGGLEPFPIRADLWTVRQTSLRGAGYNRYHRFFSGETGWSLIGIAAVHGKEARNGENTELTVAVFANLDREPGYGFGTRVEILTVDNGSDEFVTERKSRVVVDGEKVLEWNWSRTENDRAVRQRLFSSDGTTFRDLMERLEYKKRANAITLRVEWEDVTTVDKQMKRTLVEATGKGLWDACMRLNRRLDESTGNLLITR